MAGPAAIVRGTLALPWLALSGWLVADYPLAVPWLGLLVVALVICQWRYGTAWLIVLPALLPVLDLVPWSGRLLMDEYDAVLAALVGAACLGGQYWAPRRSASAAASPTLRWLPLGLFAATTLVALGRGLFPLAPLDANAWSGYLTGWNALRVGRGFLWGMVLTPLLLAQLARDRARVERDFTLGIVLGAAGFGLAVLWERGFFLDLVTARDVWGLVDTWLDLAARYRITGPFSQMHFGGSAVDGWIVLVWPFAALALFAARRPLPAVLGGGALALIAYACLVTFTRMTYLAVAVSGLVALVPLAVGAGRGARGVLAGLVVYMFVLGLGNLVGFRHGGVVLLIATSSMVVAGALLAYLAPLAGNVLAPRPARLLSGAMLALVAVTGMALAMKGILTSKYGETGVAAGLAITLPLSLVATGGAYLLAARARTRVAPRMAFGTLFLIVVVLPAVALGLGSTQMEARFSTVATDLDGRLAHWRRVAALADDAPWFGHGLGRYPALFASRPDGLAEGGYVFTGTTLRMAGSGMLGLGQRIAGWQPGEHLLVVRYRNLAAPVRLTARLARRPLLVQEYFGSKADVRIGERDDPAGEWLERRRLIDTSGLAPARWFEPRFTLFSLGAAGGGVVEVDSVQLFDSTGRDLLANGDFDRGGDRWLAFNDFEHLAWHAKSLPLIIAVEQGLVGLAAFAVLMTLVLASLTRRTVSGEPLAAALLAALAGFLVLGVTSTLFDVPRLVTLVWLMLVFALAGPSRRLSG